MSNRQRAGTLLAACLWLWPALAPSETIRLPARQLWESGLPRDVQWNESSSGLELVRGALIEDDGPAAGFSYLPNDEKLAENVRLRKTLLIDDPRAESATLLVGGSGDFQFTLNGSPVELSFDGKSGNYWQRYRVPVDQLRQGENVVTIAGRGMVWIARADEYAAGSRDRTEHPNRSAKSTDGGQIWDDHKLGTKGNVDGEYYVRLVLDQHARRGSVESPVVDLGNPTDAVVAPAVSETPRASVQVVASRLEAGSLRVRYRSGSRPSVDSQWTEWQPLSGLNGKLDSLRGRYVQLLIEWKATDPRQSPLLEEVRIETPAVPRGWIDRIRVVERAAASSLTRSAIPFEYEPLDDRRLAQLRAKYRLDERVAGAETDLDLACRLAVWSSQAWPHRGHLSKAYPAWNALEILGLHDDGTPVGGFCQQFNLVLLQACQSFGIVARAVSIGPGELDFPIRGGHEVAEIWSNEHRKWVYLDGDLAWYAVDASTRTPLSLWELRERQLATFDDRPTPAVEMIQVGPEKRPWEGLRAWPPFIELRMIPRNNFLSERVPLPLNQGMRGWSWTGHYVWSDVRVPAAPLYNHRVTRRADWEWPVNNVAGRLIAAAPGRLQVLIESQTPSLDRYLVRADGGSWSPAEAEFSWNLHAGENRLEVRSRNQAGRLGPISSWSLALD